MGWILFGFLTVVVIESFIRVLQNYEPEGKREVRKTQVSLPWFGWGLVGYSVLKGKKRRK